MNKWRPMKRKDLPTFLDLAKQVWPHHEESDEVMIGRYTLCPKGFYVYEIDDVPSGYVMSHPVNAYKPPKLNKHYVLNDKKEHFYHIHDAALIKSARGNNAFNEIWPKLLKNAFGYSYMSLVSVGNTEQFWSKFGFVKYNINSDYGTYMVKKL